MLLSMKVSVILPVYNAESTLRYAIDSILNQSFGEFELILINDGSTDNSESIINTYRDRRIIYLKNSGNRGLIYTLNRAIDISKGDYIARMDADDICMLDRFQKQVDYLDEHLDCLVCGGQIKYFGIKNRRTMPIMYYESSSACKNFLVMYPCFAHPAIMMRADFIRNNGIRYNDLYKGVEDYKLWIDLSVSGDFYNLPDVILYYRISDSQITSKYNRIQDENAKKCRREYISKRYSISLPSELNLKYLKQTYSVLSSNKYLLQVIYLSLNKYTFSLLFFYLFSGDIFKFNLSLNLRFLKRFFKKSTSLL